jgi:CheY-like chemotaxis protein/anti-sigma regulatory factor (Ser/Thr protein kinase)
LDAAANDSRYKAVIAAREEAIAAARDKTAFLSNMSHELRSPMNAMLGMAELLAETQLDDEQRHYLGVIVSNGESLLRLVNDILDFARAESGHLKLDAAEFDLIELVEGVAEMLAPEAHRKGLELSVKVGPGVPAIAIGDRRRLEQILINLASNAIKFTTNGEAAIVVGREPEVAGMIRLSVIDTGIGIEPAEHQRIFACYAQAAARPAASPGSGLGLAIVKQLAELMGGRVWVESVPGRGSRFHCTLRLGYRPRASQRDEYAQTRTLAERRLLLIGGMEHSRAALTATLVSCGAEVAKGNGDERIGEESPPALAETIAAEPRADAVLIDMPAAASAWPTASVSIIEVVKAARAAAIPVVALIPVQDRATWLMRLRDQGIVHFAVKPVRRAELIRVVGLVLGPAAQATGSIGGLQDADAGSIEAKSQQLPTMRILVADDAEDNRILIEAYLGQSGCQLDFASSGAEAIQLFKEQRYHAVLMDLHMPRTDGYEAIRQMRAWEQAHGLTRTPIIALTAAVLEDAVRQSLEAGCDSHLSKPVKRSTLFNTLRELAVPSWPTDIA